MRRQLVCKDTTAKQEPNSNLLLAHGSFQKNGAWGNQGSWAGPPGNPGIPWGEPLGNPGIPWEGALWKARFAGGKPEGTQGPREGNPREPKAKWRAAREPRAHVVFKIF